MSDEYLEFKSSLHEDLYIKQERIEELEAILQCAKDLCQDVNDQHTPISIYRPAQRGMVEMAKQIKSCLEA